MPGSAKDRKSLKKLTQQRQEQQRDRGQQRQGVTVQFQPDSSDRHDRFASVMDLHDTPEQAYAAYAARLDALLAPLPRHGEPLTPAQEAALDLLAQLAGDLAHRITDPASVHALIDRLPDLGTGCGRAVANALREAQ